MAISDIIIKSHNQKAYGRMLEDPSKSIRVERIVDMFVDDSSLTVNSTDPTLPAEIIMEQTQNDISRWSKFLWISGGLIELTKTKYYMRIWQFSNLGAPYICPEEEQPPNIVTIHKQQGNPATIK
jgi:hypothetical protein